MEHMQIAAMLITVEHRLSLVQYSIEVKSYAQPSSICILIVEN